jgi:hypothetical protein
LPEVELDLHDRAWENPGKLSVSQLEDDDESLLSRYFLPSQNHAEFCSLACEARSLAKIAMPRATTETAAVTSRKESDATGIATTTTTKLIMAVVVIGS